MYLISSFVSQRIWGQSVMASAGLTGANSSDAAHARSPTVYKTEIHDERKRWLAYLTPCKIYHRNKNRPSDQ